MYTRIIRICVYNLNTLRVPYRSTKRMRLRFKTYRHRRRSVRFRAIPAAVLSRHVSPVIDTLILPLHRFIARDVQDVLFTMLLRVSVIESHSGTSGLRVVNAGFPHRRARPLFAGQRRQTVSNGKI